MSRVNSTQAKLNCFLHFTSEYSPWEEWENNNNNWPVWRKLERERKKKNAKKKLINRQKNKIKLLSWGTQSVHFIYCIFSTLQFFFLLCSRANANAYSLFAMLLSLLLHQVLQEIVKNHIAFKLQHLVWSDTHFVCDFFFFFSLLLLFHICIMYMWAHSYATIFLHWNKCFNA